MTRAASAILAGAILLFATPTSTPAEAAGAKVTFVTGSSVYLNAGSAEGLAEGAQLVLMRGQEVVGMLEVSALSTHRSACSITKKLLDPAVGDAVEFEAVVARETPAAPATAVAVTPPSPSRRRPRRSTVRGQIGLSYLFVADRTDDTDFSQPALNLRLYGAQLGGSPWGFDVDVRARRTDRSLSDGTTLQEDRNRVYRMALHRQGVHDPWNATVGRHYSPDLAAVSIFDGVSGSYARQRWAVGIFSGTQPDPEDFGYSDRVREYGAFLRVNGRPSTRNWAITTGLIGSYDDSEINREFLYLQGRYTGPRLSIFGTQEVDYNRGWKTAEAGENAVSPTSTFVSMRYQATRFVGFHGGYDNRRNVRVYRDRITPLTSFDDSYRQGVWAGTWLQLARRYRVGLDARNSRREGEEDAQSYTLTFGASRLTAIGLGVTTRSTRYTNERREGWLNALNVSFILTRWAALRIGGGLQNETALDAIALDNNLSWYGVDLDFNISRRWFLLLSAERTTGDLEQVDQYYSTLAYRF